MLSGLFGVEEDPPEEDADEVVGRLNAEETDDATHFPPAMELIPPAAAAAEWPRDFKAEGHSQGRRSVASLK